MFVQLSYLPLCGFLGEHLLHRTWKLEKTCKVFTDKYDEIQKQLESICGRDELLGGLLSKAKGQILRVAATLHILFCLSTPDDTPDVISDAAVSAAINFVHVCCGHTSLITGRGLISEEIDAAKERVPDGGKEYLHYSYSLLICLPLYFWALLMLP